MVIFRVKSVKVWLVAVGIGFGWSADAADLTVYSGRKKTMIGPMVAKFEAATGKTVAVKFGDSMQLAMAIATEGKASAADVFWSEDPGSLEYLAERKWLTSVEEETLSRTRVEFRGGGQNWLPVSIRARTLAYSSRLSEGTLPTSVFDLPNPARKGRIGWAPTNGSFQTFVAAMMAEHGRDKTLTWLRAMKKAEARSYSKNSAIVQAIANGEVDFGLPNHYYILRFHEADPAFPVKQTFFAAGDIGNLNMVSGAAILKHNRDGKLAQKFLAHLVSDASQRYLTEDVFEYPVVDGVAVQSRLVPLVDLIKVSPKLVKSSEVSVNDVQGVLMEAGVL